MCRIIKNNPAVTRVDEWTKDDTGVGAAIAAGNQDLKGNWALLTIAAIISIIDGGVIKFNISIYLLGIIMAIAITRLASPNRLITIVIVADDVDLVFW